MRGGDGKAVGADLVGGVPVRGDPVGSGDDAIDLPESHQMRRGRICDHRMRDPERLELPGRQPRPLEERPRLVDEHARERSPLPRRPERPHRRAVAARREPSRVAVGERARRRPEELGRVRGHSHAPRDLFLVQRSRPLGRRIVANLLERPHEVDRRGAGLGQHAVCLVEVLAALGGQRVAVRRGDADRRRASNGQRPDRLGHLCRAFAAQLHLFVRKAPLVEEDDRVGLETEDALRGQLAHARKRTWSS